MRGFASGYLHFVFRHRAYAYDENAITIVEVLSWLNLLGR
jgi:hypothetical protein